MDVMSFSASSQWKQNIIKQNKYFSEQQITEHFLEKIYFGWLSYHLCNLSNMSHGYVVVLLLDSF